MPKRIVIAGGGTGGHIFPAIAIANAIKKKDPAVEILFIGAKGKMEMEKVPQAGYRIEGLDIAGFNRSSLLKNISLPFKLIRSFFQVRAIFARFQPDAAIGVGGYSSFPVLKYAQENGIATYIHEANSFAGKANQLLGKKAKMVFVATAGMEAFFPVDKLVVTGNPVRSTIVNSRLSREEAIRFFGLDPALPVILSVGGSLGAKTINEAIAGGLEQLETAGIQLIWQTGKSYLPAAQSVTTGRKSVWVSDFIKEMDYAYAAADLVVSRAGAMSIAEICVVQKPPVLVPYPYAAEDHQTVNALYLVSAGAAEIVRDQEAAGNLVSTILELAGDSDKRASMSARLGALAIRNADELIANYIVQ
ncbi:undecaprenyldiphospho-muramoylpentapeptide beta-N-acetylglucosaminyltransferase [Flavihumibacter sp. CACIAM 22H1]|uniref:undecaprenyldiphospho-muramoylpentapeptide beta-N-acetylglucosaminyltransferase n=1 Tax=Flavihumibacter sp. CACIAM 22H1 TaxID=1812911 RepID=UPI0007A89778|nr:undecaprenyldiphospho-muramoylpentapeptide beta-N-acetylglucosaminyltransferase [Flavihumibacter sp. CACIAM 22H1]KYP16519.1 MAG: UDP-N-acetylglucosamine--N-acetylmuramyl-(pentapeptide) pyrophosphoryl-undecaprenol N-acetylglucosamine transferase [Flavihumibacter sp. CACIAM 22H1]